ncbi:MAG TPA: alpha/beta hydrolase [Sedimentisphaerales bacterium]|jgi:pimeloyl-ACP methyl ester carboxylesterase|nr:alpha/beta hydrolase [Sedimentisphaerales bacterium]HNU30806.1 alpha/beta hydrolase [Sedimentisphaerales bacterium]
MKNNIGTKLSFVLLLTVALGIVEAVTRSADVLLFPGEKSSFYSYDRYDFVYEGRDCIIVAPKAMAEGRPWIWRARFFGHEPQTDIAMLERGYHLVYADVAGLHGAPQAVAIRDRFYEYLTKSYGFSKKAVLEGMSRGGLIIYNWAAANPDKVCCIYADAPVCDIKSWPGGKGAGPGDAACWAECLKVYGLTEEQAMEARCNPIDHLEPLAKAGIPLLHVVGDADDVVPVSENTAILEARYKTLGGSIQVIHKPGVGHHPHSLKDPAPIVDFILASARRELSGQGDPIRERIEWCDIWITNADRSDLPRAGPHKPSRCRRASNPACSDAVRRCLPSESAYESHAEEKICPHRHTTNWDIPSRAHYEPAALGPGPACSRNRASQLCHRDAISRTLSGC